MLKIIKGDNLEFCVTIKNVEPFLIEELEFYCKGLDIREIAEKDDDSYRFRVPRESTANYKHGFYRYELIATLMDGQVVTIERGNMLEVIKRLDESG